MRVNEENSEFQLVEICCFSVFVKCRSREFKVSIFVFTDISASHVGVCVIVYEVGV